MNPCPGTLSPSWLTVGDLLAFDWDQVVEWSFCASPPEGTREAITGTAREEVENYVTNHGLPPAGWSAAGWSQLGFPVVGFGPCHWFARGFTPVVLRMASLAPERTSDVRCVFWFDQ
jgi:hypothetical protein